MYVACSYIYPLATVVLDNPVLVPTGLIFVVDSNDRESIGEAREEMNRMLQEDEVRDAAVLIYTVNNQVSQIAYHDPTQSLVAI